MSRRLLPFVLVALLTAIACGGGTLIVSFNSGVVAGDPTCRESGGQFDLRDRGGLVVVVVITSSTAIFVSSGGTGTCQDLFPGAPVDVRGHDSGGRIVATAITLR